MSDKTGGPAFPRPFSGTTQYAQEGMTLRDYFAAQAVQGLLASPVQPQSGADMYAQDAYVIADAMLEARER